MALRGTPGEEGKPRFQFKLSRNMIIILGVFLVLIIVIVVLALVLPGGGGGGTPVAQNTSAPKGGTLAQVTSAPGAPTGIPPTQQGVVPTVGQPTQQPPAPTQVGQIQVTSVPIPTIVPGPTQVRPGSVSPTAVGIGGGEGQLPATASGLGAWLVIIPVGVLLLGVVAWWRWRRSRPSR